MRTKAIESKDITIEKTFQGAWRLSAIVHGYIVTQQYFYYSKAEAIKLFREYIKKIFIGR